MPTKKIPRIFCHLKQKILEAPQYNQEEGWKTIFDEDEILKVYRERSDHASSVIWTKEDAPILDEAQAALGPRSVYKEEDAISTFGGVPFELEKHNVDFFVGSAM